MIYENYDQLANFYLLKRLFKDEDNLKIKNYLAFPYFWSVELVNYSLRIISGIIFASKTDLKKTPLNAYASTVFATIASSAITTNE